MLLNDRILRFSSKFGKRRIDTRSRLLMAAILVCCTASLCSASRDTIPRPSVKSHPGYEAVEESLLRGVAFLIETQNPNGSWGSATRTKGLDAYAPVPGAHQAFQSAVTSLCISALVEFSQYKQVRPEKTPLLNGAIRRGEAWLFEHLPQVRRTTPDTLYNIWSHAYALECLIDLRAYGKADKSRQERIDSLMQSQVTRLKTFESVNGGWGYYDFAARTQRPTSQPTSFLNGTVLLAFHEARQHVAIPTQLTDRALSSLKRQRKSDNSYVYADEGPTKTRPLRSLNRHAGSLGRSQVCNLALHKWEIPKATQVVINDGLDRLFARHLWLDMARKRPIPHESHFLVAGYFFYYGHFYAARAIAALPKDQRPPHQAQLAVILVKRQEKDGSWWDFPLYNYHQQYGTSMSVMALLRCQDAKETESQEAKP